MIPRTIYFALVALKPRFPNLNLDLSTTHLQKFSFRIEYFDL
jgi:hypothetical protein